MLKKLLTNSRLVFSISFLLFLATLPLISIGTVRNLPVASLLGFVALVVAAALPPMQRVLTVWLERGDR